VPNMISVTRHFIVKCNKTAGYKGLINVKVGSPHTILQASVPPSSS